MDEKLSELRYIQNICGLPPEIEQIFPSCKILADAENKNHSLQKSQNSPIHRKHRNKKPTTKGTTKKKEMSPISEKRVPPILNENLKENISSTKTTYDKMHTKGPEILDFRESWLQEIGMYKDYIKNQQLFSPHNHLHTVDGCLHDVPREGVNTFEPIKRKIRSRSDSDPCDKINHLNNDDELVLKRARAESYATSNHSNHHINHNNKRRNSPKKKSPSPPPSPKIIVNPYHARLLGGKELEKIKASISASNTPKPSDPAFLHGIAKKHQRKAKSPLRVDDIGKDNILETETTSSTEHKLVQIDAPLDETVEKTMAKILYCSEPAADVKSDDGSKCDEEDFGEIDANDSSESSSDSEDEYKGQVYFLNSDEESDVPENDITSTSSTSTQYITPKSALTPSLFPLVPPYLTFASHVEKGPPIPVDLHKILKWKHSNVMPKIVKRVIINSGFRVIKKTNDWMGTWEKHMKSPGFKMIRSHQKYNHLPGTFKIGRKDSVWRNLKSYMGRHGRKEFGFMQKTFILPQELAALKKAWPRYAKKSVKWIIKPPASARGAGIKVVSRWSDIPKQRSIIVQKYIERPLLINGNKFDLRLYVLVTSINPLRVYLHTDGLARFASVQYSDKLDTLHDRCMHLTNYSINKFSANYSKNQDINACQGHKWTLKSLWSYFRERGVNTKRLWSTLRSLVIKTVLSGESCLNRMFKMHVNSKYCCYELFGFDVLLDANLIPWLLEVNISPSLHSELPLDLHVKGPLIQAVLNASLYQIPPKLNEDQEKQILKQFKLKGPLCYDRRLYTMCLSNEETKKHNHFTNRAMECREEYIYTILDNLTPDDIRCLIIAEDELARSSPLERIFPSSESHIFLQFIEGPRYYNRLLDAWETRYGKNRKAGINLLKKECEKGRHLLVPAEALKKESIEPLINMNIGDKDTNHGDKNVNQGDKNAGQGDKNTKTGSNMNSSVATENSDKSNQEPGSPTLRAHTCSKQVTNPQKQLNNEVYQCPRPIAVEIK